MAFRIAQNPGKWTHVDQITLVNQINQMSSYLDARIDAAFKQQRQQTSPGQASSIIPLAPVNIGNSGGDDGGSDSGGGATTSTGFARISTNNGLIASAHGPSFRTVTSTDTASIGDDIVLCDTTSAGFVETLPAANTATYSLIAFCNLGAHILTIAAASGDSINGASTTSISTQFGTAWLYSDGSNWYEFYPHLPASGVVAGAYTNANLTVNAQGIVTAASNGSGGASITIKGLSF